MDNAKLFAEIVAYKKMVDDAEASGGTRPMVTQYLGESIMKIATHLAYRPNFSNYTYRDEMICDGIENCLQYIDNFDPKKSKNPFAYFTQIIYFAFIRRIQKEKRYLYTKYRAIENANFTGETADSQETERDNPHRQMLDVYSGEWTAEQMHNFMENFEQTKRRKRARRKAKEAGLELDNEVSA